MWALGIRDKRLIYVIKRILKAFIQLENGTTVTPDKGMPQGDIISPLLANIVLNELDWWVDSQWQNHPVAVARGKNRQIKERIVFDKSHGCKIIRSTQLKEMHIVRYADDFRIFCPTKDCAERTLIAVTQWLKERLRLDLSPEKTRVVNLNKHYSEFLGIKMRLRQKKNKQIVQLRVSVDFRDVGYQVSRTMKRMGDRLKKEPKEKIGGAVVDQYGSSKLIRYIKNLPIAPISYVRTSGPKYKNPLIQKYTPEGRARIHENLAFDTRMLHALLCQEVHSQSAAYADNRLSLFCAQYGKCAVTGQVFEMLADIHSQHKLPLAMGGKDNYQNLILLRESVHILIHTTSEPTIAKYLSQLA